jgi:hypothetical protein
MFLQIVNLSDALGVHQSSDPSISDEVLECIVIRKSHDLLEASRASELDSTLVSPSWDGLRIDIETQRTPRNASPLWKQICRLGF